LTNCTDVSDFSMSICKLYCALRIMPSHAAVHDHCIINNNTQPTLVCNPVILVSFHLTFHQYVGTPRKRCTIFKHFEPGPHYRMHAACMQHACRLHATVWRIHTTVKCRLYAFLVGTGFTCAQELLRSQLSLQHTANIKHIGSRVEQCDRR